MCIRDSSYADPLDGDAAGGVIHPVNVDVDRVFRGQQIGEVFAPLSGHNGTLIQIIVETGGTQVVLGGDAVEVEVGQRAGAAVIVDDGKGGAADRVGAAQPLGQALTKGCLLYTSRCV